MKLLRVSRESKGYVVEALRSIRVFELKIAEKKITFQKNIDNGTWTHENGKGVTRLQEKTLQRWIRDHQKYIEK